MTVGSSLAARTRLAWLLLATLVLWLCHHASALFGTRAFRTLATGYTDGEILAAGGDLALELVLLHQTQLMAAIETAGLALLTGRLATLVAAFFLFRAALVQAWGYPERVRAGENEPLHTGWAIPVVLGVSLLENVLLAGTLGGLGALLRALLKQDPAGAVRIFVPSALFVLAIWAVLVAWLDLYRLALAGNRERPLTAARTAGRTLARSWGRLAAARAALGLSTVAAAGAGLLLLPAITRGSAEVRVWGEVGAQAGVLGLLCLRAGWLVWASGHFSPVTATADVTPASYADAPPAEAPDVPVDPSPNPDA